MHFFIGLCILRDRAGIPLQLLPSSPKGISGTEVRRQDPGQTDEARCESNRAQRGVVLGLDLHPLWEDFSVSLRDLG